MREDKRIMPLTRDSWPSGDFAFLIAIQCVSRAPLQLHAAMLYFLDGTLMIGDLQWHMRIRRDVARENKEIYWVAPDLTHDEQRMLAFKLDSWLEHNSRGIPYSVAHPGGVIFRDNVWVGSDPAQGLTCATFVVELFNELGIPFIASDSWQAREGDNDWALRILSLIDEMPQINKDAQMALIGNKVRIRPSDTFAAGILLSQDMEDSLHFEVVSPKAMSLENDFAAAG